MSSEKSAGAVEDVIHNTTHRFGVDGDALRTAGMNSRQKQTLSRLSIAKSSVDVAPNTPEGQSINIQRSLADRRGKAQRRLQTDGALSWSEMVGRLRCNGESPGRAFLSPRDRLKDPPMDLTKVVERLTHAAQGAFEPITTLAKTAVTSKDHILHDNSQLSEASGRVSRLGTALVEHKQNLREAKDQANCLRSDLRIVEESVQLLEEEVDIREPPSDLPETLLAYSEWYKRQDPGFRRDADGEWRIDHATPEVSGPDRSLPERSSSMESAPSWMQHFPTLANSYGGEQKSLPSLRLNFEEISNPEVVEAARRSLHEAVRNEGASDHSRTLESPSRDLDILPEQEAHSTPETDQIPKMDGGRESSMGQLDWLRSAQSGVKGLPRRSSLSFVDAAAAMDLSSGLLGSADDLDVEFDTMASLPKGGVIGV